MAVDQLLANALTKITEIDPDKAAQTLDEMLVVDVREPWEVLHGYLPGAVNVPRGVIEFRADNDDAFSTRSRSILLYSGDGQRSALAALTLKQLGYRNVYSLAGGIQRWLQKDLPVI